MKNIIKLLLGNIRSHPKKRYSIVQTQDILEEICYNLTPIEYKKIILYRNKQ